MEQLRQNEEFKTKIIEEINLIRKDPPKYAEKIRNYSNYFKGNILKLPESIPIMTTEGAKAFQELAEVLEKAKPLPQIKICPGLNRVASDSLIEIQKIDDIDDLSNLDIDGMINKHGEVVGPFAQAVDFGSNHPEVAVINLLVDDGDINRGNRNNILNPKFKLVGVTTGNHNNYKNVTVVLYARHFFGHNEDKGELSDDNYEDKHNSNNKKAQKNVIQQVEDKEEDFSLPPGVERIERQEKLIVENGVNKKMVKLIKRMEDGSIETEVFKEKI